MYEYKIRIRKRIKIVTRLETWIRGERRIDKREKGKRGGYRGRHDCAHARKKSNDPHGYIYNTWISKTYSSSTSNSLFSASNLECDEKLNDHIIYFFSF